MYINKSADIIDEYNNTYHSTIKLKIANVKSGTYIEFAFENNDKDPKFEIGNHVRISKYKAFFKRFHFKFS